MVGHMASSVMGECDDPSHDATTYQLREKFMQQAILTEGNRVKREISDSCKQNIPKTPSTEGMKNTGKGKEPSFKQATSNTTSCIKLVAEDLNSFVQGNHGLSGSRSYGGFEPHCGSYDSLHFSYPQLEQTTTLITEAALIRVS